MSDIEGSYKADHSALVESLARYMGSDAFVSRKRSRRNSNAAYLARKFQRKQAKTALRFFLKPERASELAMLAARKGSDQ